MEKNKLYRYSFRILVACTFFLLFQTARAQTDSSSRDFWNDTTRKIATPSSNEKWIDFRVDAKINATNFFKDYGAALRLSKSDDMRLYKIEKDNLGFTHYRFMQYYKNIRIAGAEYILHVDNKGVTYAANGQYVRRMNKEVSYNLSNTTALQKVLSYVGASKYMWQEKNQEDELKQRTKKPDTSYYPKGELVWTKKLSNAAWDAVHLRLAYQFDIYASSPNSSKRIEIDANTGEIINDIPLESDCTPATVTTIWNGSKSINTDLYASPQYRLKDSCQAASIRVRDWNSTTDVSNNPLEITSNDNTWTNNNQVFGGSVLWAIKTSYNFYQSFFSRNSYDNAGGIIEAYINVWFRDQNGNIYNDNASMNFGTRIMKVGLGKSGTLANSWATIDIIGHEYTHAVTGYTADLTYSYESGALNEGYSDIFGSMVQYYATGETTMDYLIGENRTDGAIRSMWSPNTYQDPDTYKGFFWYTGTGDEGGVHTNSGVLNYWFYLLSEGLSGSNDFGNSFTVTGISSDKAVNIAYRALTVYLTQSSQYADARTASIKAAKDIYGTCSNEAWQTAEAWYAVGVGTAPPPLNLNICGTVAAGNYAASSAITSCSGGTATVSSAAATNLTANDITFLPGFTAVSGCNFQAYITPCTTAISLLPRSKPLQTNYPVPFASNESAEKNKIIKDGELGMLVYPNPAQTTATLQLKGASGVVSVTITNIEGKVLWKDQYKDQYKGERKIQLPLTNLSDGIYLVTVKDDTHYKTLKVIKQ